MNKLLEQIDVPDAPCIIVSAYMAKTEPIIAPRHLVVANSEVMIEDSG